MDASNWHTWGVQNKDGTITGDNKGTSPMGHVTYGGLRGDLTRAGYFKFWDPHPDHAGGVNFMTKGSPTLNITVFAGHCPYYSCSLGEPDASNQVEGIEAHKETYNPHEEFLKHQKEETIPNAYNRVKEAVKSLWPW